MIEIILYAIGIMYTPGPVNAICLNSGIQKQKVIISFCAGVALAMFILFSSVSIVGEKLMNEDMLQWTSVIGALYILWLAYKIFTSPVINEPESEPKVLSLRDGLMLQLLNPKGITVALPVATVQFPAAGITGLHIVMWCAGLAVLAFGAPLSYYLLGKLLGRNIRQERYLTIVNKLMAFFLVFVGINMGITPFLYTT
ncbi:MULTISPECIES: LysE family translocator [Alteromonas]|jgi:threonine/homoserine/homoserine lactone efflux protein|uniref:LysE family translocator n=1 Tax=Alteromonas TaxID=226 RepID=UPI001271F7DD|nr:MULTISPECIES: LysE family transporter [Alteromonas]CAI2392070.1 Threonine/homoserine/homoserine lactone efflux protein [Alteromonas macleodii]CAI3970794.1 Threonine/homoserine/homoserine lactone efflux protein [Alteromonas macleodii]CAI3970796.1 Threonine/homoserine/homoserine lactone efflux protein [Alteromonas macleodii]CAI3971001.1 Threonine/homoserine/homoserine lactone efflux protein [Alteromonas macleodii]VTO41791.1 Threonine/homoserine/homoserine lactone efflux protein [Alteromonas m|tara:strand:- start:3386 stop:3979 length:594 start_codon:yes stop_codon:yes gene_type:complete